MAVERARPYAQFNFLVDLGGTDTASIQAGFQEVSGLGFEVAVTEYRNGNEKENAPRKMMGLAKVADVTLKRGVIGTTDLYQWLSEVRSGSHSQLKTVTIQLQNEERSGIAMTWKLMNARPIKYTGPSLSGKGSDVAIEELVLACERIEIE
ncbi:MAG TPA: phage tail protein [Symbiobacteriaceae bacterium]|nr:phage tail protein [Symbiobacteriaceae bacterium]